MAAPGRLCREGGRASPQPLSPSSALFHPIPSCCSAHTGAAPGQPFHLPRQSSAPMHSLGGAQEPGYSCLHLGMEDSVAQPHTPQWMTPQIVAWGKDPVFTRGGLNLCTEMLAGWISSAGVAAPTQFGLVCKWIQRDVTPTVSPPGYPQNRGTCWPFLGTHGSYGTLHPLPGTHRTVAFTVPFWRPTNLWHSPPPPGDPQSRGTRRLCPVPGSGGGSGRIAA